MRELKDFIKEMTASVGRGDFRFDLLRWSKEEPYWCVFACEHGPKGVSAIGGASGIGGHYCIGKEENLHDVLSMLSDSGWKVEIHPNFFRDMEDLNETEKETDPVQEIPECVFAALDELAVSPSMLGYDYLSRAIVMAAHHKGMRIKTMRILYPEIAKKYNTTIPAVDRDIRYAIDRSFQKLDSETIFKWFGNSIDPVRKRLTNTEYIMSLATKLRKKILANTDDNRRENV